MPEPRDGTDPLDDAALLWEAPTAVPGAHPGAFAEFEDGYERGGPAVNRDWPAVAAGGRWRALVGAGLALRVGLPGECPVPAVVDAETAEPIKADPAGLDAARAALQARKHARTA